MLPIKFSVKFFVLLALCITILASCSNPLIKRTYPEVDFTTVKDVQLTYNDDIYNIRICYDRSVLSMQFCNNGTAYDGISYKVTPDFCEVNYSGLVHSFERKLIPEDYLPALLWQFFYENGSSLVAEGYDKQKECCYLTRTINNCFIEFEAYKNEGNLPYALIIT